MYMINDEDYDDDNVKGVVIAILCIQARFV